MMRSFRNILMLSLMSVLTACNFGVQPFTEVVSQEPVGTEPIPTEVVVEAEPTKVEHEMVPGEFPEDPSGVVGDQDSSITSDKKRAPGGDRFTFTRFERPFNAETMDEYYPYIDIQDGLLFMDETWIYVAITMKGGEEATTELKGRYGLEIDLDVDGGGDWLILASNPVSSDWTTDGVEAWFDTNDDVGGDVPTTTDSTIVPDDGYETLEFGTNVGNDPDFAWVRILPDNPHTVQLAIKTEVLQGSERFLAGLWAGEEDLDPAMFDLSDHYTHEQAGAAMTELEYFYPIKQISALDNTCRMAVGFQPTGREPGLCPLPPVVGGEEPPVSTGCAPQYIVCTQPQNTGIIPLPPVCYCNQP